MVRCVLSRVLPTTAVSRSAPAGWELSEKLHRLGASQWAYADAVVHDARDTTLVGERLNQIKLSLSSMDTHKTFVREYLDPMWDTPAAQGLDGKFPGLRLPVSFPHAQGVRLGAAPR